MPAQSPFPGMDPWLESHWRDVHARLVIFAAVQLQGTLPPDLRARVEERVYVESDEMTSHEVYPKVRIIERTRRAERAGATISSTTSCTTPLPLREGSGEGQGLRAFHPSPNLSPQGERGYKNRPAVSGQPLIIHLPGNEPVTETWIEIRKAGTGNRVVTVIEFLSVSNKLPGEGRKLYRKKQRECRAAGVSLVEIDLVRAGKRVLAAPAESIPPSHRTTYQVCVRRGWTPNKVEVYRVPLRERLPVIRVPLRQSDSDVSLDLQPLIERCYETGAFDDLDYARNPRPALDADDAAWADEILKQQGLKS